MRLYLDANAIVYLIEGTPRLRQEVLSWIDQAEAHPEGLLVTPYLSTVECRVKPLRSGQAELLSHFEGFFGRDRLLLADVTRPVLDKTTDLRARFGFKSADAIHLATAVLNDATVFLTADSAFKRFTELQIALIDPGASQ